MADSAVAITAGTGTNIDSRTESTNGNHRQVVVLGDPTSNSGVAPVDATNGVSVTLTTALPAGTNAFGKLAANDGIDIGDVTINNSTGASAVNIQDGGNVISVDDGGSTLSIDDGGSSITVDGTVSVSGTVTVDSELPAAAALADATVNPTAPAVGSFSHLFNGTTWDRMLGDTTNGLDVDVTRVSGSVTVAQATAANLNVTEASAAAIKTAVEIIDDWDETDRCKVNPISGQVGVAGGSGVVGATTQRVVLATDVALPTGSNAIGKLAANSGVDIGDVDVTSIATGTNAIGRVGHDITGMGHGVTTVTTAGTDVVLAASTACKRVFIQAQTDNTNVIAVGVSGVDATIATGTGILLFPGDVMDFDIDNLADIYIDSLVDGEGVRYTYFT